jgi:hypothetical protein
MKECVSASSTSLGAAKGCASEDPKARVRKHDDVRSKVVHLFPEPDPGYRCALTIRSLDPKRVWSNLASDEALALLS